MLAAIALTPSAPVLVPELAGRAVEAEPLRAAAVAAAAALPQRWIAVGVGPRDESFSFVRGTFAGYGADVEVALSPEAPPVIALMPLCALVAGWLRGQAQPQASVAMRVYGADLDAQSAVDRGRVLRAEIDSGDEPIGVLVVADGANTLTQGAPGGFDPDSEPAQAAVDRALAAADTTALTRLPECIIGRVAYEVLAGLAGSTSWAAQEMYRGAPYGVGYFAGVWRPATA